MVQILRLRKTGGSRLENVDTYRVACKHPKDIVAMLTYKSSMDDGSDDDTFVHVALAKLIKFNKHCVMKVFVSNTLPLKREMEALQHLENNSHVVQYVFHFSCNDHKSR